MAEAFKKLDQRQCPASATTLYTVPASTSAIVKHIRIVNTTASDVTVKLWQSGVADTNVILPPATVLAGGWAEFDGNILMAAAETLSGLCSTASAVTITTYGLEIT